jgi:hypothetical protein
MRFKQSYFNLSNLFQKEFKSHTYEEHHLHVRLTLEISLLHNFLTPFYSLLPLSYVEHVTHTQQPLSKPSCAYVIILLKMIIFRTSLWAETIFIRTRALEVHLIIHFMYLDMTLPSIEFSIWKIFDLCQRWPQWYRNWADEGKQKILYNPFPTKSFVRASLCSFVLMRK